MSDKSYMKIHAHSLFTNTKNKHLKTLKYANMAKTHDVWLAESQKFLFLFPISFNWLKIFTTRKHVTDSKTCRSRQISNRLQLRPSTQLHKQEKQNKKQLASLRPKTNQAVEFIAQVFIRMMK